MCPCPSIPTRVCHCIPPSPTSSCLPPSLQVEPSVVSGGDAGRGEWVRTAGNAVGDPEVHLREERDHPGPGQAASGELTLPAERPRDNEDRVRGSETDGERGREDSDGCAVDRARSWCEMIDTTYHRLVNHATVTLSFHRLPLVFVSLVFLLNHNRNYLT